MNAEQRQDADPHATHVSNQHVTDAARSCRGDREPSSNDSQWVTLTDDGPTAPPPAVAGSAPQCGDSGTSDDTLPHATPLSLVSGSVLAASGSMPPATARFHPIKLHAKGGLGEVFIARDSELGRKVALKQIRSRHCHSRTSQDRFVAEAVITGALEHPGIVPVYGLGRYSDGRPYYAMRFVTGKSFQSAINAFHRGHADIQSRDYFSREFKSLLRTFVDLCRAIHYAHEHGVLHRDIKPENVMLGSFGETLVVDWGLAKLLDIHDCDQSIGRDNPVLRGVSGETLGGAVLGTPAYMSPEQAHGKNDELTAASDVYSLGATLFTLLSGERAVDGDSSQEVILNVRQGKLRPLETIAPHAPRALISLCYKAMRSAAAERYSDAGALVDEVERWLADDVVLAHRSRERTTERLGRWVRRHHSWVVAGGLFLIAFLMVAALAVVLVDKARQREAIAKQDAQTAKAEAIERYRQSRSAIDAWLVGSNEAMQFYPGTQSIRKRMLELAAQDYLQLATSVSRDPDLELERARALVRVGNIHQIQQRYADARQLYGEAIEALASGQPPVAQAHLWTAESAHARARIGISYFLENRAAEADAALAAALKTLQPLSTQFPDDREIDAYLTATLINRGEIQLQLGHWDAAILSLQAAITRCDARLARDAADAPSTRAAAYLAAKFRRDASLASARARELLGRALEATGQFAQAEAVLRVAIDSLAAKVGSPAADIERSAGEADAHAQTPDRNGDLAAPVSDDLDLIDAIASAHVSLAASLRTRGRAHELEASLQAAANWYQTLVRAMPDVPRFAENLALTLTDLGIAMLDDDRPHAAMPLLTRASGQWSDLLRSYSDVPRYHEQNAACEDALAQAALVLAADPLVAFGHASAAVRAYQELAELFPETPDFQHRLAIARSHAAIALSQLQAPGNPDDVQIPEGPDDQGSESKPADQRSAAALLFNYAVEALRALCADHPTVPAYRHSLAHVLCRQGQHQFETDDAASAEHGFAEAMSLWSTLADAGHGEAADELAFLLLTCRVAALRDHAAAWPAAKQAVAAAPFNPRYQNTLAVAAALNDDASAALAALQHVKSSRGHYAARDYFALAIIERASGNTEVDPLIEQGDQALQAHHPGSTKAAALRELVSNR